MTNNITIINPPTRYRNQAPGATIVPNQVFHNGNPVATHTTHLSPQVTAGQAPIASANAPRAPRSPGTQMPDRRQGDRPGAPAPRPRFTTETPPIQAPAPARPAPGAQAPKHRVAEPGTGGPLPAQRNFAEPRQDSSVHSPSAPANPPAVQPKVRPQPGFAPPAPGTTTSQGAVRVESAPAMPDRQVRPDVRPETKIPAPHGRNRPQQDVPSTPIAPTAPNAAVAPIAAPAAAPRQPAAHPQPAAKDAAPPAVKQAPGRTTSPQQEAHPDGGQGKSEARDGRGKPAVSKD